MHHPYLNTAILAARTAGLLILQSKRHMHELITDSEGNKSYLTKAELLSEDRIIKILHEAYPTHNFLTKNQGHIKYNPDVDNTWIIHPLDGSNNFISGFPYCAISIALRQNNVIQHSVIYNPLNNDLFIASIGEGASLNNTKLRIKYSLSIKNFLISIDKDNDPIINNKIQKLSNLIIGVRQLGSISINLAYIASGYNHIFLHSNFNLWEIAAGSLMIIEAGGCITDYDGNNNYLDKNQLIATHPKILNQLLIHLKSIN
jgi:myo-inositol-1(or 4)-monophosphatase